MKRKILAMSLLITSMLLVSPVFAATYAYCNGSVALDGVYLSPSAGTVNDQFTIVSQCNGTAETCSKEYKWYCSDVDTGVTSVSVSTLAGVCGWGKTIIGSVNCTNGTASDPGSWLNTSGLALGAQYSGEDYPKMVFESVGGIGALIASFATIVGLILVYKWFKGKRVM